MKYLVTGGAGFIGSHLIDHLLAAGHAVRVLDDLSTGSRANLPQGVELVVGDVADRDLVGRCMGDVDGCFHLAAIASVQRATDDWVGAHRTNLTGAVAVFDAARATPSRPPIPVVFASSAAVYGSNANLPLTETERPDPLSAYGADKLGCELHGAVAGRLFGVQTTGLRFFNVYGPRQDPQSPYSGVISIFVDRMARGQPITVNGDGLQTRDFIFVGDVVRALYEAMRASAPGFRVFNVCSGVSASLLDLVAALEQSTGRRAELRHGPARQGDVRASLGDPTQLRATLGATSQVALVDGLRATVAWARSLGAAE